MQPRVTVVLATVWLVVSVGVVEPATLHPSHLALDQYSPLPAYHHGVYRRVEDQLDWKDQNPAENQPFDLSIGPQRSISVNESPRRPYEVKHPGRELMGPRAGNEATSGNDFPSLREDDKQSRSLADSKPVDGRATLKSTKVLESSSREIPPSELEDPFVADDTFQDQGPGSVEIYKLDLFTEKGLVSPTSTTRPLSKSKSKVPKKTGRGNWKSKTSTYKTTSPKISYKQSNSFDESPTDLPPPHGELFAVGGVPELQVGCEGLEASVHKMKRSIDSPSKEKGLESLIHPWIDVTPISLDLDYELSSEDVYEEMDELLKLKKLETTTKRVKQNRGDMEATLHSEFFADKRRTEKLPVRGDLGDSGNTNESASQPATSATSNRKTEAKRSVMETYKASLQDPELKPAIPGEDDARPATDLAVNQGRKLLSIEDSDEQLVDEKRSKRHLWGYGEDEGVVSSDELQTENQRRRQEYERRRKDEERRRQEEMRRRGHVDNQTNSEVERIRDEYEKALEQRRREEEERQRRVEQEESRRNTPNRWSDDERRREEERRREHEENLRRTNQYPRNQLEEERLRRVQEEERRRNRWNEKQGEHGHPRTSESEETRRRNENLEKERRLQRQEEENRQRQRELEMRRREQARQIEMERRRQEEEDRRNVEERERKWAMKRKLEEEDEKRRQQQNRNEPPTNLYTFRSRVNDSRPYETESDRRLKEQQEREREEKLREYIQRNRPINVDRPADRRRQEEERRRMEEQRRRYRPEDRRDPSENLTDRRREEEERRRMEEEHRRRQRPEDRQDPRQNVTDRRREEEERRRLEEQRRRHYPENRQDSSQNLTDRRREEEERRRMEEEHRRRQRPEDRQDPRQDVTDRRREEEERRRLEEQRRRHRPEDRQDPRQNVTDRRREEEERRRLEEQRRRHYPDNRQYPSQNSTDRRREEEERRRLEEQRRRYHPDNRQSPNQSSPDRNSQEAERKRMEHERRLEEERKLQDYIRRNQPVHVSRTNESSDRNWLEYTRNMDEARLHDRSRYPVPDTGRRSHGPSAPTYIDPRGYVDEARRQQEARRLEEESRARERQRQEQDERRKEALRREEEVRRMQSRRYEEERKRLEAVRLDAERRRKELIEEETRRGQAGRTRTMENARPVYEEQRGRQDTSLIPGNLVLDESRRAMERERQRQEQERRRLEAERRRQEENRTKDTRQNEEHDRAMREQWRRQEQARLNALPVSARIMLRPKTGFTTRPVVISRTGFANEIDFTGINPSRQGVSASKFPAAATLRPPVKSPGPCVWAVLQCCPANSNRLVTCFESMGCPGINWDPSPCRPSIAQAAREEVMKFYAAAETDDRL